MMGGGFDIELWKCIFSMRLLIRSDGCSSSSIVMGNKGMLRFLQICRMETNVFWILALW